MRTRFLASFVLFMLTRLVTCANAGASAGDVALELRVEGSLPRGGALPLVVVARIDRGWHINAARPVQPYLVPTELTLALPSGVEAEPVRYPEPQRKTMAFAAGQELLLYAGEIRMSTTLHLAEGFPAGRFRVEALLRYQACNDTICLSPRSARAEAIVAVAAPGDARASSPSATPLGLAAGETKFGRWLTQRGLAFTLLAAALVGLGLNLTPCVYPLISVTVAYFGRQSRFRAGGVWLAVVYVVGIAFSFAVLGVVAALSGALFGSLLQEPVVVLALAAILVTVALSNFGVYQFRLPVFLARRLGRASAGVLGALLMGLTMGIVAAPCVGPVVVGLLIFVAGRQEALVGFLLFFALAIGLGAPYVVLAVAAGSLWRLPRSGEWLVWMERVFGCILLAAAGYLVSPLLPHALRVYVLPVVMGLSAVYLGFLERTGNYHRRFLAFKRAAASGMLLLALWLGSGSRGGETVVWQPASWLLENGRKRQFDRPLVIDFAAEWCIPCRRMDQTTYVDPEVVQEARRFHMVRVDVTRDDPATAQVVGEFGVLGVPTVIVFSSEGQEHRRAVGYVGPEELLAAMRGVR